MFCSFALLAAPVLLIRAAQVEITPPEPLPLGGYTKRMGKVMDLGGEALSARAVAFEYAGRRATMVSLEMLTVPESLVREVKKQLPEDIGLMLVATHTHCAPDSQMLNDRMTFTIPGIATYKSRWLEWYAGRVAECVKKAWAAPGVEASKLGLSRVELKLNRGRRKDALPDPIGTLFAFQTPKQEVGSLFFSYAAHATLYDDTRNTTSGDWPGAVSGLWGIPVFPGAIGDVSPVADNPKAFASSVFESFKMAPHTWFEPRLKWVETPIALGNPIPHPEFAKTNSIPEALAKTLCKKFAPQEAKITGLRLGDVAILGIPGEPTSHLGRAMQALGKQVGFDSVLVFSHVNGWVGYILEPEDYDRGGYEATLAMHGREFAGRLKEAAMQTLRNLAVADADK